MKLTCASCGAPAPPGASPLTPSWDCEFCESANYNEEYVKSYLQQIDLSTFSNNMELGKVAYEGENYEESARWFDLALTEDASSFEGWAYKALSLAHMVDLSNLDSLPREVESCLTRARSIAPGGEFVGAAEQVARALVVHELIRLAERALDQARKASFAFSHDREAARARSTPQLVVAQQACLECLALSPGAQQVRIVHDLARESLTLDGAPSNPSLSRAIEASSKAERVAAKSCFPRSALVATPHGPRGIGTLAEGDLVLAYSTSRRQLVRRAIVRVVDYAPARILALSLKNGGIVRTTSHHTIATTRGWRVASEVRPGDRVLTARGGTDVVQRSDWSGICEPVWNLHVCGNGTYVVDGCIVHSFTRCRTLRTVLANVLPPCRRLFQWLRLRLSAPFRALGQRLLARR